MTSNSSWWVDFFSLWGFVGGALVVVGVVLESAELVTKWGRRKKFRKRVDEVFGGDRRRTLVCLVKYVKPRILPLETVGFVILFIGLAVEVISSGTAERMQSRENEQLEATNVLVSRQVEIMRSNNVVLEAKTQPRIITVEQMKNFKLLMQNVKKIPVKISIGQEGFDTETYAKEMRDMFNYAGFETPAGSGPWGVFRDTTRVEARQIGYSNNPTDVQILFNWPVAITNDLMVNWNCLAAPSGNTNFPLIPIVTESDSTQSVFAAIDFGLKQIGITTIWEQMNGWIKTTNDFGIVIPAKNF